MMSENHTKSKLKRKKSVAEQQNRVEGRRSVAPAAAWWSGEQLPAVETLFALTLTSVLQNQPWDSIPDLPHPSAARPSAQLLDEQHWCDLGEEVAPFPEPSLPGPDPLNVSSTQQNRPLLPQSTPVQFHTKARRQEESYPARPCGVRVEEGRKEKMGETRKPLPHQLKVHSQSPTQKGGEKKMMQDDKQNEEQEVQSGGGGVTGGRLLSCPMCLLEFPAGFTQMDCDGHLAQCLSDMNVDMTW